MHRAQLLRMVARIKIRMNPIPAQPGCTALASFKDTFESAMLVRQWENSAISHGNDARDSFSRGASSANRVLHRFLSEQPESLLI